MKRMPLEHRGIANSRLVYGCMGLGGDWNSDPYTEEDIKKAEDAIEAALSIGITMFDHADIYRFGKAEAVFGEVLKRRPELREQMVIQSKCGIRFADDKGPKRFDFSKEYILSSVDQSLERLGIDYLDILLLHRPDSLMDPEEVAEAFRELKSADKVRSFGVSNMSGAQMRYLQTALSEPLVVNQLEMSLMHRDWLDQGVHFNQSAGTTVNFPEGTLEYCQLNHIQIQAWGSLAQGLFSGRSVEGESESIQLTAALVSKLAVEKETTKEAIVLGWLMRHPAYIQPVIGTANPERIKACQDATRQAELMTREEWYDLYVTARGVELP